MRHSWFLPREENDTRFLLRHVAMDLFFGEAKLNFMSSGNNKTAKRQNEKERAKLLQDNNFIA